MKKYFITSDTHSFYAHIVVDQGYLADITKYDHEEKLLIYHIIQKSYLLK